MDPERKREEIFAAAIEFEDHSERDAYIAQACGKDQRLLKKVQSLLDYHDGNSFLDVPALEVVTGTEISPLIPSLGEVIGRYKLLEKIGEGGMAVVYMAEQMQPIKRKVALKIIKLGMDTKQVIARFEAERQALAMMDHPNIAKVLDAGATETGRPYFVMELVSGVSITEYCDKNNLNTKERLALFIQVCNAVQHAHQKGIIHRDIKPTNVMVEHHDGKPVPKVIDFGIAKATNQRLTEKTLFTRYAHIIGTPAYMSPEQADLGDMDVDTRSDIYSLGVLLYELLTGITPFDEEELRKVGYIEMQRIIREQEPTKPSTKLSTLGQMLTDIAKYRASTPDLLTKAIRGDLDWIVMKALEKTRDRRYDNASALALDIQRHLDDQPILARAPSAIYLLSKFLRRYRSWAATALVLVILFGAFMIALEMWNRKRLELASAESITHHDLLNQARALYSQKNYAATLRTVRSILNSNHLGGEAKLLYDIVIADIHREISHYSSRIESNSQDAGSYLSRARYYHCLGNKDEARTDMNEYRAILNPPEGTDAYEDWFMGVVSQEAPAGFFFGTPENLGPTVNSEDYEWFPRISDDGLSLYFSRNTKRWENWITTRVTQNDPWNTAVRLLTPMQARNRDSSDSAAMVLERRSLPSILASLGVMPGLTTMDGLELYGWDARLGGYGDEDIFVMKRETIHDVWTEPCNIGSAVNTQYAETLVSVSPDGLELYFCDNQNYRPRGQGREDLWMTRRASRNDPWQEPENLGPNVNSPANDSRPHISADGLLLFFDSRRPEGYRESDLYVTKRKTTSDPWEKVLNLGPRINAEGDEYNPCISADRRTLFFVRNEDIWQVSIINIENRTISNSLTRSTGHLKETNFAQAAMP